MIWKAKWIAPAKPMGDVCPLFYRNFHIAGPVKKAILHITAVGVYEASINGQRAGDFILAPGWTSYQKRHQYQDYDVTELLTEKNELCVLVGKGWYRSPIPGWITDSYEQRSLLPAAVIAQLDIETESGNKIQIVTDESWQVRESRIRFSEIYDGEHADFSMPEAPLLPVRAVQFGMEQLIPQEGEIVRELDRIRPKRIFRTPKGEVVVDFGQEVTGYVRFNVRARKGDIVEISHAEVLDRDGNFYTENYRNAKAKLRYICCEGEQTYQPHLTFYGFRYIRLDKWPGNALPENFEAVLVSSDMKRTGTLNCGIPKLNKLFENIVWSQRDNFLDVPTDCPQRDERLGWTGDIAAFIKTACFNFDVEKFFRKWLQDLKADQLPDGSVPHVIPDVQVGSGSAAWGDASVLVPWQLYLFYGDEHLLSEQYESMEKYLRFIRESSADEYLWTGGKHFGDWLGLDAPQGSYKGRSRDDFIASAYYAYDVCLMAKIARILGKDASEYEDLYDRIVQKFRKTFPDYLTQTENVLALVFGLTEDPERTAKELAQRVLDAGKRLETGFVGTQLLLFALSRNGYTELAYDLLLREEFPSWLYQVDHGATTVWEHWDGIMPNGEFWSPDMNSFNHYAYGAVMGWVYEEAAGIHTIEESPGFRKIRIEPKPDRRLGWLEASLQTRRGLLDVSWRYEDDSIRYEIQTPSDTDFYMDGRKYSLKPGRYVFFGSV